MELVAADGVKQRLRATVRELKLPPKKAAAILASVNLPAPKRRHLLNGGTAVTGATKSPTRRRKGEDGDEPAASKPVLVLGR